MNTQNHDRITIVVIDDDPLVRLALQSHIAEATDMTIVAEAEDGDEAIAVIHNYDPDVLLLDLRMPRLDGVEVAKLVRRSGLRQRIVVLTAWDNDRTVQQALAAGAHGFMLKASAPSAIRQAIRDVIEGHRALDRAVMTEAVDSWTQRIRRQQAACAKLEELTQIERDVAEAVGIGYSNQEISERLYMSLGNVKATLSRVFDKLGTDNRVQLAVLVMRASAD